MLSKYTQRAKPSSSATQIIQTTTFFWLVPPWRRPQTPQNRPSKASKTTQNRCSIAYAYRHRLLVGFGLSKTSFWEANQLTVRPTVTCLCSFQLIFNFSRMSWAFCMFFMCGVTTFWHREHFISITFWATSPAGVSKTKRDLKTLSKWLPKPAAEASLSTWKGHQKPRPQKLNFLRLVLFGRFAVFEAMELEMGPRLYIDIYIYIY